MKSAANIDEAFCYTPFNLAVVIDNHQMRYSEMVDFLTWVYNDDSCYLSEAYRDDPQKLTIATMQYLGYLHNKEEMKSERAAVAKDYKDAGIQASANKFFYSETDPYHYLKTLRLRILYFNKSHQAHTTLRQIFERCGFRKRNREAIAEIEACLNALNLLVVQEAQGRGMSGIKLDERITLKIKL